MQIKNFNLDINKLSPKNILVVSLPSIGDALLSSPLIANLKLNFPNAKIDLLVRSGSGLISQYDKNINKIIEFKNKNKVLDYISMVKKIFRKYDLALSTSTADRATLCCLYAAPFRVGLILPKKHNENWWKTKVLQGYCEVDFSLHTILQNLRLLDVLGLKKHKESITIDLIKKNTSNQNSHILIDNYYVVLHCISSSSKKDWEIENWLKIIDYLDSLNFKIVLTGGSTLKEFEFVKNIESRTNLKLINMVGKLDFYNVSEILKKATLFIGVDTCTTHLASLIGTPVIALFGESNVEKWAPWPRNFFEEKLFLGNTFFENKSNVYLINGKYLPKLYSPTFTKRIKPELVIETINQVFSKTISKNNNIPATES